MAATHSAALQTGLAHGPSSPGQVLTLASAEASRVPGVCELLQSHNDLFSCLFVQALHAQSVSSWCLRLAPQDSVDASHTMMGRQRSQLASSTNLYRCRLMVSELCR